MQTKQNAPSPLGRNWTTAEAAHLTEFPEGDAMIRLTWADGAGLSVSYENKEAALAALARLGFAPTK